jgi:squalene-hopene cyclase-like protein
MNSHTEAQKRKKERGRLSHSAPAWSFCAWREHVPLIVLVTATFGAASANAEDPVVDQTTIRTAIEKSLPLLQAGAKSFRDRSEGRCIACHHQGLVLQTVAAARERGFAVDEDLARAEVERVHGFYARRQERYRAALKAAGAAEQADPFGNFTVHAGYWLWGLAAEKVPPDDVTATTARLLAAKQLPDGHWTFTDVARAPMQASDFTTTALAVFVLDRYAPIDDAEQTGRQIALARKWLLSSPTRTTDDKAFRLFGLLWSRAPAVACREAAAGMVADQRADGGWGQQANMPSDAYATGLALVALHQAGEIATVDQRYQRGVDYLVKTQKPDGSWLVKTRAIPTNPYFESGFPHGKSQFISYAGTCWAALALLATTLQQTPAP